MKHLRIMRSLLFESDELIVRTLREWKAACEEDLVCVTYGDMEVSALATRAGLPSLNSSCLDVEIDMLFIFSYTSCDGIDEYHNGISRQYPTYWFNFDKRDNITKLNRLEGRP